MKNRREFFYKLSEPEQKEFVKMDENEAYRVVDEIKRIKDVIIDLGQHSIAPDTDQSIADILLGKA